jgi:hypothetical protein
MLFLRPNNVDLRCGVSTGLNASGVVSPGLGGSEKYEEGLPGDCAMLGVCSVGDRGDAAPDDTAR